MKKIYVRSENFGFWTQTPVRVRVLTEGWEECLHQPVRDETGIQDTWNPVTDQHDTREFPIEVCVCGYFRSEHTDIEWEEA